MQALTALLAAAAWMVCAQSFEAWSAKAQKAQQRGETAVAIDYWGNALRMWQPSEGRARRARALAARAALYQQSGQWPAARKDLDEALKADAKNAKLFDQRGTLQLAEGRLADAISDFYSATKLSGAYGPAYLHRAQAYEKQGDALFAGEDYRSACRLGVKEACPFVPKTAPAAKPGAKPAARAGRAAAPPAKKAAAVHPLDLPACRAALTACSERGNALSACVKKASPCEAEPRKGCCPRDCLNQYSLLASEDKSDAEVFREVFSEKGSCAREPEPGVE